MIDELVLEQLLAEIAEEIAVPVDGAERVVHELSVSTRPSRRPSPGATRLLMVAAAIAVVVGGITVLMHNSGDTSSLSTAGPPLRPAARGSATPTTLATFPGGTPVTAPPGQGGSGLPGGLGPVGNLGPKGAPGFVGDNGIIGPQGPTGAQGVTGAQGPSPQGGPQGLQGDEGIQGAIGATGATGNQGLIGSDGVNSPVGAAGPVGGVSGRLTDTAKIIKNGALDLQVPHGGLQLAVNRVTSVAVGLGGYIANSRTSFGAPDATAQITLRIPSANFEAAVSRLGRVPGVTILDQSVDGLDVTAAVVDLQARLSAATAERDALLGLLANATNLNDILTLHDRETAAQTTVDQLQGRINLLGNQAAVSSIAITLSEKPAAAKAKAAVHHKASPRATGLSKAWKDAHQGFSDAIEWLLARSGGALIALLAALALLFGVRYLYPVVRRGLL